MNMQATIPYTLNVGGQMLSLEQPLVMGILNATEESFHAPSRSSSADVIAERALMMLGDGATILDVGGCSTKPGLEPVSEEEEMRRLSVALEAIRRVAPEAVLSVDTFRASIAERCVRDYGVQIINDVYGGEADERMFDVVAALGIPYILTHAQKGGGNPHASGLNHSGNLWQKLIYSLAERINRLHLMGVGDVIVDPGFGFGKTLDDNYNLMAHLEELHLLGCPLLVGVSRKSMIYNLLGTTPDEALNGTTALHAIALMKGAHILRVHDVKAAVEAVKIVGQLKKY